MRSECYNGSGPSTSSPKRRVNVVGNGRSHHHHQRQHHAAGGANTHRDTTTHDRVTDSPPTLTELPPSSGSFLHISITKLAIGSRLFVIVLQLVANLLLPDHEAGVFVAPSDKNASERPLDALVRLVLGGLNRWDGQYFLHIAEHGYTYENALAFFPLFPFILKIVCSSLSSYEVITFVSYRELSLLLAVLLNVVCFTGAAKALYRLSKHVLGNQKKAEIAVLLFCFNPASIFFTAPYTESLYAWLSFVVMYQCIEDVTSIFLTIPLSLSILCRSNGMFNIGFVLYFAVRRIVAQYNVHNVICICSRLFSMLIIVLFHYGIAQVYNYYLFCFVQKFNFPDHVREYAAEHGLVLAGNKTDDSSPWCTNLVPLSYSYVQSHYWNVGFLRYYELKQLPNFLLALPVVYLVLSNSYQYLCEHWEYALRLGLFRLTKKQHKVMRPYDRFALVFVVHALVLTLFSLVFVHVQVTTRLLCSASPVLYWYTAEYFTGERAFIKRQVIRKLSKQVKDGEENSCTHVLNHIELSDLLDFRWMNGRQQTILVYFLGYTVVGTVLFSNFYPWT
uniref:GPI mannosyltransferase 2 n=1 Tax=Anopheles arabiensis TaxID=7173 RepID=A0A2C9GQI9_ANOAR